MKIAIGADHGGFELKAKLIELLSAKGIEVEDCGTHSAESTDYPDYARKVARAVSDGEAEYGVLICGTGIGMSMAANKVAGVRAALCTSKEMASFAKRHNNANVICLGARIETSDSKTDILDRWLDAEFEGGRHERRVNKIHEGETAD